VAQHYAEVVVVGAGVVGLACAAALARVGRSVVILERHARIASEITSRNSQVVHAGLYYPVGSLKAELCVAGAAALYARCSERRIPHRRVGKLVVATTDAEAATLESLRVRGEANGARDLALIDRAEVTRREPDVVALAALDSPHTGIVDAAALCFDLLAEAEAKGALLSLRSEARVLERTSHGWRIATRDADGGESQIDCGAVINAAGLAADAVAERAGLDVEACGYRQHYCKGDYFALAAAASIRLSHLVYPVPADAGLGVHATLDLGGRLRFGPDAEYRGEVSFAVDPGKAPAFAALVRRYLPALDAAWLTPDSAGVRPKLAGPGEPFRDFVVQEESRAGFPGLVNCIGIESPGLTAALALADRVTALLRSL
jgi:L-2-hydroxyglutarate oxidase LhgO